MRFYQTQRRFYCGIDLHANQMLVCVLDDAGEIVLHRNLLWAGLPTCPRDGPKVSRFRQPVRGMTTPCQAGDLRSAEWYGRDTVPQQGRPSLASAA